MQKHGSTKHEIATVNSGHLNCFMWSESAPVRERPENQGRGQQSQMMKSSCKMPRSFGFVPERIEFVFG